MPAPKQTIREIRHIPPGGFEEQLWPINMALLVLSGMVAGWILATLPFQAEVWWRSGWVWLAAENPEIAGATPLETTSAAPLQIARAADESATLARRSETLAQLSRHTPQQPKPALSAAEMPSLTPQKSETSPLQTDASAKDI